MAKSNRKVPVDDAVTAAAVAEHLLEHWDLLRAVTGARSLGPSGVHVVETVLSDRSINFLRCSWQMWEYLHEADGYDTDAALAVFMPFAMIQICREALGVPSPRSAKA